MPFEGDPDAEAVARARHGDLRAFEDLVERYSGVVYRVAARIVGPEEADDVSQDAFLRAYHRLDRYRGEGHFRSWLLQITHNTALSALSKRRPEPVDPGAEAGQADLLPVTRDPVTSLEGSERRRRLESKIRMLRGEHRAVLVLRDVEGMTYEEIGTVTGMPLGSVKGRLHRARQELIDLLRRNTYDWDLPR